MLIGVGDIRELPLAELIKRNRMREWGSGFAELGLQRILKEDKQTMYKIVLGRTDMHKLEQFKVYIPIFSNLASSCSPSLK